MRNYITTHEFLRLLGLLGIPKTKQGLHHIVKREGIEHSHAETIKLYPIGEVERLVKIVKKSDYIQEDYENVLKVVVGHSNNIVEST